MPFDFKKEQKEFYRPGARPSLVELPAMNFVSVRGEGDPNEEGGAFSRAVEALYGVSYALKMSYRGPRRIPGFFEYVVPPLEGLWERPETEPAGTGWKASFLWVAMIRLPDFVRREDVEWACREVEAKKKADVSQVSWLTYQEGLCVQCLHTGPYDDEPATLELMEAFAAERGLKADLAGGRHHHEIYLSDPRKVPLARMKTALRLPLAP